MTYTFSKFPSAAGRTSSWARVCCVTIPLQLARVAEDLFALGGKLDAQTEIRMTRLNKH